MERYLDNKLQESEDCFRILFEKAPVAIGLFLKDGQILFCNEAILKLTGYQSTDIKKLKIPELFCDDSDYQKVLAGYNKNGFVRSYEINLRKKAGTGFWANVTISSFNCGGKELSLIILMDITSQKNAATVLKENEAKYRALAENTSDILYSASIDGIVTYISPQVSIYGFQQLDFLGKSILDIAIPEDREMVAADFKTAKKNQKAGAPLRFRIISRHGQIVWCEERALFNFDDRGNCLGFTGIVRDITEQVAAENALKESEDNFRMLLEKLPDAVTLIVDNKPVFFNSAFMKLTGYEREEIFTKTLDNLDELVENYRQMLKRLDEVLNGGFEYLAEYIFITKTGERIPVEVSSRKIIYHDHPALLSVLRNLSERKKMELQIQNQNQQLKRLVDERSRQALRNERLASVGRLVAGYVHQINNPIQSLYICLDKLATMTYGNEPLLKEVQNTRLHIRRVADLGKQLKCIYQPQEPDLTLINVNEIILEVTDLYASKLMDAGITLKLKLTDLQALAFISDAALYSSLGSLILNAIDAMPKGGELSISTLLKDSYTVIEVADTGIGIPTALLPKIFEPFFTTKTPDKGTGLGLTLVKEAIEATGGTINLSSEVGHGTSFTITLLNHIPKN